MAMWVFSIVVIPATQIPALAAAPPELELIEWWRLEQPDPALLSALSSLLPVRDSWSPRLRIYGLSGGTSVEILMDDHDRVRDIELRIDCSMNLPDELISSFAALIAAYPNVALISRSGRIVSPTRADIVAAISRSPAGRFRTDPERALIDAANEVAVRKPS